jgi:hypothetical protein
MAARDALTEQDVRELRDEAVAGRPGTVWFTDAAVGVPAGRSAKVVSVAEPPEGDFIQVRPAGSRDTVFCSPGELSRVRPARRRADPAPPAGAASATPPARARTPARAARGGGAGSTGAEPTTAQPTTAGPTTAEPTGAAPAAAGPTGAGPAAPPAPAPARPGPVPDRVPPPAPADRRAGSPPPDRAVDAPAAPPPPAPPAPPAPRARPGRKAEAATSVRLTATPDGEWQAEVFSGTRRVGRAVPVPAADVAVAARALPAPVAEAITAALEGARQRQLERVERLRAELDAAQRALDQLAG